MKMKTLFSTPALFLFYVLSLSLFCRVECTDSADDPQQPELCGSEENEFHFWKKYDSAVPDNELKPGDHYIATKEGWAYYEFAIDQSVENVCPDKHITGSFELWVHSDAADKIKQTAEIMYGILYTHPIASWEVFYGDIISDKRTGKFDFGIKHLFGEEAGWFFPTMTIIVEDQGDVELTHSFLKSNVSYVSITCSYYRMKAK